MRRRPALSYLSRTRSSSPIAPRVALFLDASCVADRQRGSRPCGCTYKCASTSVYLWILLSACSSPSSLSLLQPLRPFSSPTPCLPRMPAAAAGLAPTALQLLVAVLLHHSHAHGAALPAPLAGRLWVLAHLRVDNWPFRSRRTRLHGSSGWRQLDGGNGEGGGEREVESGGGHCRCRAISGSTLCTQRLCDHGARMGRGGKGGRGGDRGRCRAGILGG